MDADAKKFLLRTIPFGLYVAGARDGDRVHAFLLSWFSQCSFSPPLVMAGVKRDGHAHDLIVESGAFSVNFLGKEDAKIARDFLRTAVLKGNTLSGHEFSPGKLGAPILLEAPGYVECKVLHHFERGDHTVVVGEVVEAGLRRKFELLTHADTGWKYGG